MKGCRPLTTQEVDAVLTNFSDEPLALRNKCLFVLGLNTGLRVSELLSFRVTDVYQSGQIQPSIYLHRRNAKGQTEGRTIRLNAKARAALKPWLSYLHSRNLPDDTHVFCSIRGKTISRTQAWRIFDRTFSAIGLTGKLGTHFMRKTFADRMYDLLGGDLKQLQGALGHKWITSTSQYLSFKEDAINDAIDSL